jgi:hypothetical protein
MAVQQGVSIEWIEAKEDEIARMIIASEQVQKLRTLAGMLRSRGMVSNAYYHDMLDSLDYIAGALQTGKRNTAQLRNGAHNA